MGQNKTICRKCQPFLENTQKCFEMLGTHTPRSRTWKSVSQLEILLRLSFVQVTNFGPALLFTRSTRALLRRRFPTGFDDSGLLVQPPSTPASATTWPPRLMSPRGGGHSPPPPPRRAAAAADAPPHASVSGTAQSSPAGGAPAPGRAGQSAGWPVRTGTAGP